MEIIILRALEKLANQSCTLSGKMAYEDDQTKRSQLSYCQVLASARARWIVEWRTKKALRKLQQNDSVRK